MQSCRNIFVLLTICLKLVYSEAPGPENGAPVSEDTCASNTLTNNPLLLWTLRSVLYTIYTSKHYEDNEIFNFEPNYSKNVILTRTTNAALCCKSMNVDTIPKESDGNYFKYVIATDKSCTTQLTENARMKLLAVNTDCGGYCLMLWTCRTSREGVHAFCTHKEISPAQKSWIKKQYKAFGLSGQLVKQNKDYSKGPCFDKCSTKKKQ